METASCKIAAVEKVKKEILPNIKFEPILRIMATAMTRINKNGSNHEVVVRVKISQIMTTAIPMAIAISLEMDS